MKLLFDLHTHTLASGHAYSTLHDNIAYAKKSGLLAYGFSEHAQAMPGSVNNIYFMNFKIIPREIDGLHICCGVEANIIDFDGNLDCNEKVLNSVDYVIASLHVPCIKPGTVEDHTRAFIGAMQNPYVKIIGHPDDSNFMYDYDAVVKAAVETKTVLELNCSSLNPQSSRKNADTNILKLLETCKRYGAKVIVSTDSHICYDVGIFDRMLPLIEQTHFPEELIVNTSMDGLNDVLNRNFPK